MDLLSIVIGLALLAAVGYFIVKPVLQNTRDEAAIKADERRARLDQLEEERQQVYDAIRELDLDHALGKLSDEEHASRREQLAAHAVALLQAIDNT